MAHGIIQTYLFMYSVSVCLVFLFKVFWREIKIELLEEKMLSHDREVSCS